MVSFLSNAFFKSFSSKYVYIQYRQQQWRPLMYSLPNILYMLLHPHVRDQLLWINGYSCTLYISYAARLFKIFLTRLSDFTIHRVWGRGGWWQLWTQQADEQPNFEWYRQKLLAGKEKENSQIFNADFYLPLYLPLWLKGKCSRIKLVKGISSMTLHNHRRLPVYIVTVKIAALGSLKQVTRRIFKISK